MLHALNLSSARLVLVVGLALQTQENITPNDTHNTEMLYSWLGTIPAIGNGNNHCF